MCCWQTSITLASNTLENLEQLQEQRWQFEHQPVATVITQEHLPHLSTQQLLGNPKLLEQLLDNALETQNINAVHVLLPIYQQSSQQDEILLLYAQATLASSEQNHKKAIDLYRKIIAKRPELAPMRLNLAFLLLTDKQFDAAKHQLDKISHENDLPNDIKKQIEQAHQWIARQQQWAVQARLRYLHDKNINQAPKTKKEGWTLPQPQSAQGMAYYLSLNKSQSLTDNWAIRYQGAIDGKSYNKHNYDDLNTQVELGISHRHANQEWLITPIYGRRWFATKPYSQSIGLRSQYNQRLSPHWQVFTSAEYIQKKHRQRHYLDGASVGLSSSVIYTPSASQSWVFGINAQKVDAKDTSERYDYTGAWVGWEQEWQQGLSVATYAGIAKRGYQYPDVFQIQRQDKEYFSQVSIWHRALHWQGLTPKLVWSWQRSDSNHFMYGYDKHHVFMEVSKTF